MPQFDPQSFRFRVYSVVEVRNTDGTYRNEYPRIVWEEPPGREIGLEVPERAALFYEMAQELSRTENTRVALAKVDLFTDRPVEFFNTLDARLPAVAFIQKAAVWVPVAAAR